MTTTALINARLIDGTGTPARDGWGLIIEDGRITYAGPAESLRIGPNANVLDLGGRTVMPGLIDAHTHLTYHAKEYALILQQMNESLEFNTLKAAENAKMILETGCTAVGDGACRGHIASAIRDGVAKGVIPGPKVVAAGQMLSGSGGIGDHTSAWGYHENESYLGITVNGVEEVQAAVRKQIRSGVDWVKVTASGTPGNPWIDGDTQDLSYDEISAAVREAGKFGKPVHAHAHDPQGIKDAVRAGVISLHSGEYVDDEGLAMMAETGCVFVPTIAWLHFRIDEDYAQAFTRSGGAEPADVQKFIDRCGQAYESCADAVRRAQAAGAPIGVGSDASHVFPPYDLAFEMEYLQDLGLSALEVIQSATQISARAVGRGDSWGTLETGKAADLLVVDGDPSQDVRILRDKDKIVLIMQDGQVRKDGLSGAAN
jgi:imidazolonepropionase-like amidohydrolase